MATRGRPPKTPEEKEVARQQRLIKNREYCREWHKRNPDRVRNDTGAAFRKNKSILVEVTPAWANEGYIKLFYQIAKEERRNGNIVEVDHLVPINHPLVCGLHVEWNLQVATKKYNHKKQNSFWPDMPEYSFSDYEEFYGKNY